MGCDENGIIQGVKAVVSSDTGGYMSLGGPVLQRACTHAAGPYAYENFEIEGTAYYTNNPPAGAFRGFGVTQTCFATETLLNMMADKVGITPWEIRYRNAIRPGGTLPNGQIVDDSTGLVETLEAVKEQYERAWNAKIPVGIACAMKNAGGGVGIPDTGRVKLIVEEDGKLHIFTGASCIGQGLGTVLVQMIVENTDIPVEDIVYERSNTWISPDSGTTSGSRQTLVTGEACRRACEKVMEDRAKGLALEQMIGKVYYGEYLAKTDPLGADVPNPVSHVACGSIGIGEITSIPTAPAITDAYFRYDGERRFSLPIKNTPYERGAVERPSRKEAVCDGGGIGMPTADCDRVAKDKCATEADRDRAVEVLKERCIGCGLCARNCTANAIRVVDKCAVIDEESCLSCGMCVVKCPKGAIRDLRGIVRSAK